MANLVVEDSERFGSRLIMMGVQVCCLARIASCFFSYFFLTFSDFVVSVCLETFPASCGHFYSFEKAHHGLKEDQLKDPWS